MYAGEPIGGMTVMSMDYPAGSPFTVGNNIVSTYNTESVKRTVPLTIKHLNIRLRGHLRTPQRQGRFQN